MDQECCELMWSYTEIVFAVKYNEIVDKYQITKMNNIQIDGCNKRLGLRIPEYDLQ